jgi:plasmid stabilization system protein ParE
MRIVRRFPAAEVDLVEIGLYIAQDSPANAERFIDALERECRKLANSPFDSDIAARGCIRNCGATTSSAMR